MDAADSRHQEVVCGFINAETDEIAFVKCTSHSLSVVSRGLDWEPDDNVVIYEREIPSNIHPWLKLQRKGVEVKVIPSRGGRALEEDIEHVMDSKTRLVALSAVRFSNGFRIDLKRTGELCRQKGVLFCVDAIQSLGVIPMDVKAFRIDFLAADEHKWLLGPEGIGIFYCRKELAERLRPPLVEWKSVQNELDFWSSGPAAQDQCAKIQRRHYEPVGHLRSRRRDRSSS